MSLPAPRPAPERPPAWDEELVAGGTPLTLGGNTPFPLIGRRSAWRVESGRVEVFAVALGGGRPLARVHLASADVGSWLFGGTARPAAAELELEAVPAAGTRLVRVDEAALAAAEWPGGLDEAFGVWLDRLCRGAVRPRPARMPHELARGATLDLVPDEAARPSLDPVWATVTGRCRLWGDERLDLPAGAPLPLPTAAWIAAAGEARVAAADGPPSADVALTGYERLLDLLLVHLRHGVDAGQSAERDRLARRHAADRAAVSRSAARLATVLLPRQAAAETIEPGGDPLHAAARLVAATAGIELHLPAGPAAAPARVADALNLLGSRSRVRHRRVLLRDDWWRRDNGPLLAFLAPDDPAQGERRPVALLPLSPRRYQLVEPVEGTRTAVDAALAGRLTGDAYMFYRPLPERPLGPLDLLRALAREGRRDAVVIVALGAVGGLLALALPLVTGALFGRVIPSADRSQLAQMTLAWIVAALGMSAFRLVRALGLLRVGGRLDSTLQPAVWDRLLALPVDFFRRYTVGDLADRAFGVSQIRELLAGHAATSLLGAVFAVFSFALLFYFSPPLALAATGVVVLLLAVAATLGWLQVVAQRRLFAVRGRIASLLFALIHGLPKLRVAGAERRAYARWAERFAEQRRHDVGARRIAIAQTTFLAVFQVLALAALFAVAGLSAREELPVGRFLAFNAAFGQVLGAVVVVVHLLPELLTAVPVYERLSPILTTAPEVDDSKAEAGELRGEIEVSNVTFRYADDLPNVLHEMSLHARPGEFVALVGPSGSGKSTCLRLLLGFERPRAGSIYYDGQDLAGLSLTSVRRQVGVVLQNGRLMAGTIFSNIVGDSDLGIDEAWEAARLAGLDEDVRAMAMGMHTIVSEGAGTFSGGQKQRLLIARAIVHRPRILFFDEATSALDNRVQEVVSRSLERLEATRVVVAHRLSTIARADRIYVVDGGRVVESGTYRELVAQDGLFARLASRQTL
ncbi:MAG TPA: NHLP bacteriocin export ABC transporter permease/ATPase subunit [Thermoanaerobaculia bacterium]|nr:NHLP bacteriocin export ABC transporter permease/ATPase subunit [Thermoanaerobaculia bacterium]